MNDLTKYLEIREEMKTGDLLLWQTENLLGTLIRLRTGKFTHASLIIRMAEWEGQERRRYHIEAGPKGFYPAILSNEIQTYGGHIWWYPLKDEYNPFRTALGLKMTSMFGIGYDFLSLARNIWGRVRPNAKKLYCSEGAYMTYDDSKIINPNCEYMRKHGGWSPTPSDLPLLELFKKDTQFI